MSRGQPWKQLRMGSGANSGEQVPDRVPTRRAATGKRIGTDAGDKDQGENEARHRGNSFGSSEARYITNRANRTNVTAPRAMSSRSRARAVMGIPDRDRGVYGQRNVGQLPVFPLSKAPGALMYVVRPVITPDDPRPLSGRGLVAAVRAPVTAVVSPKGDLAATAGAGILFVTVNDGGHLLTTVNFGGSAGAPIETESRIANMVNLPTLPKP